MKRKLVISALALLGVATCYLGGCVYFGIFGHHGTAANTQALARVYRADDPKLAAFYTNSFIHKLRFTAPIRWHRAVYRPSVTLTSQVDVVAFRRDMGSEPFVNLSPRTSTIHYFEILHRVPDDWMVTTEGTLDTSSGAFEMSSRTFFRKVDDFEWQKLTNAGRIIFTFDTRSPLQPTHTAP